MENPVERALGDSQEVPPYSGDIHRIFIQGMGHGFAHCQMVGEGQAPVDWLYLEVNPAFESLTGLKNVVGKRISEVLPNHRITSPELFHLYDRVVQTGVPELIETFVMDLDAWLSVRVFRPRLGEFIATFENISAAKRLKERGYYCEDRLRNAFEASAIGLVRVDLDGRFLKVNPAFCALVGRTDAELEGITFLDITHPDDVHSNHQVASDLIEGRSSSVHWEKRYLRKDGRDVWAQMSASLVKDHRDIPLHIFIQAEDITDRKRSEAALQESEGRWRTLTEQLQVGVLTQSPTSEILQSNPKALELLGLTENQLIGKTTINPGWNVIHEDGTPFPGPAHPVPQAIATLQPVRGVVMGIFRPTTQDRVWLLVDAIPRLNVDGSLRQVVCTFSDITELRHAESERQRLTAEVNQLQKLESLGTLASGVAHDMNNVLGAILALASAHLASLPKDTPLYSSMETIRDAATRGGDMVKRLLAFSRQTPSERKELNLNKLLLESARLLERTTLAKVHLEMDLAPDLHTVLGDASALTTAWMNLCVNAVDAMGDGGTLTFRTHNLGLDQVKVTVEDTGKGMSREVLDRAIEPFFTTKPLGKGTGLGLSLVFSTVRAHGGQLKIQSEPDRGTQVAIIIPATVARDQGPVQEAHASQEVEGRAMRVLLVDDDELIQKSTRMLLEVLGHAVTLAASGEAALAVLEQGLRPDTVILDLNMPGLGGKGTLPRLRRLCPTVPVFLATGRSDQEALDLVASQPFVTLLSKPYGFDELQGHLQEISH